MSDAPIRHYTLYIDEERPEVAEDQPWAIRDVNTADWALKRLGQLKAEKEEIDEQYKQALSVLQARRDALLQKAQRGIDFFTTNLVAFAELNKRQLTDGKTRSRSFLHGRIGFRKQAGRVKVVDEGLVIEWAKKLPLEHDLLRFKAEINKDKLNDYVQREGIVPDGCEVDPERDNVIVSADAIRPVWNALPVAPTALPGGEARPHLQGPGEGAERNPASGEGPGKPALPPKVR